MTDVFRPRSEPALTLYLAFQKESAKRGRRDFVTWNTAEVEAVWSAARDYSQKHGLRVVTLPEVKAAEVYASGHVDYGATWAYRVAEKMTKL